MKNHDRGSMRLLVATRLVAFLVLSLLSGCATLNV